MSCANTYEHDSIKKYKKAIQKLKNILLDPSSCGKKFKDIFQTWKASYLAGAKYNPGIFQDWLKVRKYSSEELMEQLQDLLPYFGKVTIYPQLFGLNKFPLINYDQTIDTEVAIDLYLFASEIAKQAKFKALFPHLEYEEIMCDEDLKKIDDFNIMPTSDHVFPILAEMIEPIVYTMFSTHSIYRTFKAWDATDHIAQMVQQDHRIEEDEKFDHVGMYMSMCAAVQRIAMSCCEPIRELKLMNIFLDFEGKDFNNSSESPPREKIYKIA
jgi:hypothetical protein